MKYDFIFILLQLIGPISIVAVFIFQLLINRKIQKREIYQKLEFASIDLFRYENTQSEITWRLYNKKYDLPSEESKEYREMINHVTQILNLFEMAVEFRKDKIISYDIFSTWVPWIWEMTQLKNFVALWSELENNYSFELKRMVNKGIESGPHWENYLKSVSAMHKYDYVSLLK